MLEDKIMNSFKVEFYFLDMSKSILNTGCVISDICTSCYIDLIHNVFLCVYLVLLSIPALKKFELVEDCHI